MDNTTTAPVAPVETTTSKAPKKYTCGISESLKNTITEFRKDFSRPAAIKNAPPVAMTEKEALEVLHTVATDRRFEVNFLTDEDGNDLYDEDGNIQTETVDLIDQAWEEIKLRDYSETVAKTPTIAGMIASVRKYGAALKLTEETIQAMIDAALKSPNPTALDEA